MHLFYDCHDGKYKRLQECDTLVIGGGGMKGAYFLGAIAFLEETNIIERIKNFFGTSIGAIICLFSILNYSSQDQMDIVKNKIFFHLKSFSEIKDSFFKSDVPEILKEYIEPTMTFEQLYKKTEKNYNVIAFDCTRRRETIFSHTHTPHASVYEAVCASCAVPLLFDLVRIGDSYFTDGGIVNNLPVDHACNCKTSRNILILFIGDDDDDDDVDVHRTTEEPAATVTSCSTNDDSDRETTTTTSTSFSPNIYNLVNVVVTVTTKKCDNLRLQLCNLKWKNDKKLMTVRYENGNGIYGVFYLSDDDMKKYFKIGYTKVKNVIFSKV